MSLGADMDGLTTAFSGWRAAPPLMPHVMPLEHRRVADSGALRGWNRQIPRGGSSIACLDAELRRDYNVITQRRSDYHED